MLAMGPVPQLTAHQSLVFLSQLGLLLGLALAFGRAASRFGMPALVGELSVGLLLGPSVIGHVDPGFSGWLLPQQADQFHLLDAFGQFGVVLVVGITGVQVELRTIRRRGTTAVRVSLAGLLVPLGLGVGAGYLLADRFAPHQADGHVDSTVFALFLGVAMCVSAIPVVAKTLADMDLLHRDIGQLIMSAAAVDDLVGWLLLSVVSAMATTGVRSGQLAATLAWLAFFLLFAAVAARPLVRRLLTLAARAEGPGATIAVVVVLLLGGAVATQSIGLEPVFGAFLVGVVIGTSGALDPVRLAPLNITVMSVLAPVFFATAGLRADLTALAKPTVLAAGVGILALSILGKFGGAYLGARASRLERWEALALGAGMNARGVIEVVVAMVGLRLGVLNTDTYTVIILVAIVTSLMAPPVLRLAVARIPSTPEESFRRAFLVQGGLVEGGLADNAPVLQTAGTASGT